MWKKISKWVGGLAASIGFGITQAFAALPASVATDVTAAKADGSELGYLLLGMAVAVGIILWLKRKAG